MADARTHIAECIRGISACKPVNIPIRRDALEAQPLIAQIAPAVAPPPLAAPKTQDPQVPPRRRLQFKLPQSSGAPKCRVVTLGYFANDADTRARVVSEYRAFLRDPRVGIDWVKHYSENRCTAGDAPVQPKWSHEPPVQFFLGDDKVRVRAKIPKTDTNVHLGYFRSIAECDRVRQEQRLFWLSDGAEGHDYANAWITHQVK